MIAVLAVVTIVGLLIAASFYWLHDSGLEREKGLPYGEAIMIETTTGDRAVHQGDTFPYLVEVLYDPDQVAEIDKANLGKSVHLEPFEIRGMKEREFTLPDSGTRVYQRKYELQLLEGKTDTVYKFPTLTVRYRLQDDSGFLNKPITPKTVFIASRLPANTGSLELRPLKGKIQVLSQEYLTWILWVLGGLLAILGIVDLVWRVLPQWKGMRKEARTAEGIDTLSAAYRALHRNIAGGIEAKTLLHQMDHMLRIVLAHKNQIDWLDGADLEEVPSGIRPTVISLFERCQKAYQTTAAEPIDQKEALAQLEEILNFYFNRREVEAWKS